MENPQASPREAARSYESPGGPAAVLCLHGLTSSPYELRPLCDALAAEGAHVLCPRLMGHGSRPEHLRHHRWADWLAAARRGFEQLAARHDQVFLVGLSMGALLAIVLAHERGARVAGVCAMATPLRLAWRAQAMLRLARLVPVADALPYLRKDTGPDVSDAAVAAAMPGYDRVPLAAAASLLEGQALAADRAGRLRVPVLVMHGRHDHVSPVENAHLLMSRLRTPRRRLIVYPRSWHILPMDVEHEAVVRDVTGFVRDPQAFTEMTR